MIFKNMRDDKILIYLADPDHFRPGNRISIPLGIGSIASYCKNIFGEAVEILLFKNPEELIKAIKNRPPNILGCSFFMWNKNLTLKIIEASKALSAKIVTVVGGPNVARNSEYFKKILKENPTLDIVVLDQGEKTFANVVKFFLAGGREELFKEAVPGCALRLKGDGEISRGEPVEGGVDINKFPSPYLAGYFDHFLEADFLPSFETVRGCPHQCTFCGGGVGSYMPLSVKDEKTVYDELLYIFKRSKSKELDLIDTNFGIMEERDLRISRHMLELYDKYHFPRIVGYATTKHKTKTSMELMVNLAKLTGFLYFALQTLDDVVLRNCRRNNMPLDLIKDLVKISKDTHWPIFVDLIFGLPEETRESFLKTVDKVAALGLGPQIYQLRLLKGTIMAESEREKYDYKTKFRMISNRFGQYNLFSGAKPIRVVEAEEVACQNKFFSFEDYLAIRSLGLMMSIMFSYGALLDTVLFLMSRGIGITKIITGIQKNCHNYPRLHDFLEKYDFYSRNELFDSEKELRRQVAKDEGQWKNLLAGEGQFFKLDLGFVGNCLFENTGVLDDMVDIIKKELLNNFSASDLENFEEVARRDKLCRITQSGPSGKIRVTDLKEEIEMTESFDYDGWKAFNFEGNLRDYSLKIPVKQIYYVENFDFLIKKINEYDCLSGFLFYERILLWGPKNLRRMKKNIG